MKNLIENPRHFCSKNVLNNLKYVYNNTKGVFDLYCFISYFNFDDKIIIIILLSNRIRIRKKISN